MTTSTSHSTPETNETHTEHRDPAAVLAASSFSAGIALLPKRLQKDARQLYHLLRTIDDLVDENDPQAAARVDAIECWANGEKSETPEIIILSELSSRYPLSREAFSDFCEGMRHDLAGTAIATEPDLERYCHQVGGTVGIMLTGLLGVSHPDAGWMMDKLGTAMQRTNILRDIDEDHANGRLYIAATTIERFGAPTPGAREALLRDQIARADVLYEEGLGAIPLLEHGQRAMALATVLYREILRQIERGGFGRTSGRTSVPSWRKRELIGELQLRATQVFARSAGTR